MTTLTYRYLGDALHVGEPLGADSSGWPYQVVTVTHIGQEQTTVELEPWPIPLPTATDEEKMMYKVAMEHARMRMRDG